MRKRHQWRKLHITLNTSNLEVIEATLTENSVGDSTEAKHHLKAIENEIDEMLADGAYDCQDIYNNIEEDGGLVTIPPPINAVVSKNFSTTPTQRDEHVTYINQHGRPAWEVKNHDSRRLLAENFMGRFKGIIGSKMRSRSIESQEVEVMIGCSILNRMTALGTPIKPVKAA